MTVAGLRVGNEEGLGKEEGRAVGPDVGYLVVEVMGDLLGAADGRLDGDSVRVTGEEVGTGEHADRSLTEFEVYN